MYSDFSEKSVTGRSLEFKLVESQNRENEEEKELLSIENDIPQMTEKLCNEKTYAQYEINPTSFSQVPILTTLFYIKLTELSHYSESSVI